MQEQCRRADVLGRLDERKQRGREKRLVDAVGIEDLVGERREGDDEQRRERASHDLQQQRLAEEAAQTPPVLARDVAEAVLRERLLHREVEQDLEEAHDDERRRENAEVFASEDPRGDDRPDDAAGDSGVDPRSRRRPASEHPGGHPRESRSGSGDDRERERSRSGLACESDLRTWVAPYSGAVTTEAFDSTRSSSGLRNLVDRDALGALVLALSLPFLFIHERYQPELGVGLGSTTVDIRLSDLRRLASSSSLP